MCLETPAPVPALASKFPPESVIKALMFTGSQVTAIGQINATTVPVLNTTISKNVANGIDANGANPSMTPYPDSGVSS